MSYKYYFSNKPLNIELPCIVKDNSNLPIQNKGFYFNGNICFDTGANISIFPSVEVGWEGLSEKDFIKWALHTNKVTGLQAGHLKTNCLFVFALKGIDKTTKSIYGYAYQVEDFSFVTGKNNSFSLGSVPIVVVFDPRFKDVLFGKDLLRLLNTKIDCDNSYIELERTQYLNDCMKSNKHIDGIYMQTNATYKNLIDLDSSALEKALDNGIEPSVIWDAYFKKKSNPLFSSMLTTQANQTTKKSRPTQYDLQQKIRRNDDIYYKLQDVNNKKTRIISSTKVCKLMDEKRIQVRGFHVVHKNHKSFLRKDK